MSTPKTKEGLVSAILANSMHGPGTPTRTRFLQLSQGVLTRLHNSVIGAKNKAGAQGVPASLLKAMDSEWRAAGSSSKPKAKVQSKPKSASKPKAKVQSKQKSASKPKAKVQSKPKSASKPKATPAAKKQVSVAKTHATVAVQHAAKAAKSASAAKPKKAVVRAHAAKTGTAVKKTAVAVAQVAAGVKAPSSKKRLRTAAKKATAAAAKVESVSKKKASTPKQVAAVAQSAANTAKAVAKTATAVTKGVSTSAAKKPKSAAKRKAKGQGKPSLRTIYSNITGSKRPYYLGKGYHVAGFNVGGGPKGPGIVRALPKSKAKSFGKLSEAEQKKVCAFINGAGSKLRSAGAPKSCSYSEMKKQAG